MKIWTAISLLALISTLGCARWSNEPSGTVNPLPLPKLAPESVILSVVFVRVPPDHGDLTSQFWPEVDEQVLPNELRRRLDSNGIRCGLIGAAIPAALQVVLDSEEMFGSVEGVATVVEGKEPVARSQKIHSRSGQEGKIMLRSNPIRRLATLTRADEGNVQGESLDLAQLYFSVKSFPQGDGSIKLELTPIAEHGQAKSRFAAQQGVWALDNTSRPVKSFEDLKIEATLAPGQSLAIGSAEPHRGLGQQLFVDDSDADQTDLLLLVRLQQTQLDDRFDPESEFESILTALD